MCVEPDGFYIGYSMVPNKGIHKIETTINSKE